MKKFLLFLTVHVLILQCFAQDISSLEKKLSSGELNKKDSLETLYVLGRSFAFVNPIKSLEYTNLALQLSNELDNPQGIANAYRILSAVYSFNESYFISMDYLQRSLDIFEELKDSTGIANCYISLGHTYRRLKQREEEIKYHKASYEIFSRLGIKERIGVTSHNLGESYYNIGDLEKSRQLTQLAISINDSIDNRSVLSSCYKVMGLIELAEQNIDAAESEFKKVLKISDELGENSQKIAAAESMLGLASLYKLVGDFDQQESFLIEASRFSKKHNLSRYLQDSFQGLIQLSTEIEDNQSVSKYLKAYEIVNDSIESMQFKNRYDLINTVIQIHDLTKDKVALEKESIIQSQRLKNRNNLIIGITLLFLIILLFLYKYIRLNQKLRVQKKIVESQNSDLEILNSTKSKFFSIVAHDLKSPLISLQSFSTILLDHFDALSKDQIKQMGGKLRGSVDSTIKLAENLITWASIQMNEYQYMEEDVSIKDVAANIYNLYKDVATKKAVSLDIIIDEDLTVSGDRNQIAFILRNLINNAIKFSNEGGKVSMKAYSLSNGGTEIAITDDGVGMKKETMNTLFTLGQSKSTDGTAGEKGTGLGLILIQEFIQLNKAQISVESQENQGSTFTVTFKKI